MKKAVSVLASKVQNQEGVVWGWGGSPGRNEHCRLLDADSDLKVCDCTEKHSSKVCSKVLYSKSIVSISVLLKLNRKHCVSSVLDKECERELMVGQTAGS